MYISSWPPSFFGGGCVGGLGSWCSIGSRHGDINARFPGYELHDGGESGPGAGRRMPALFHQIVNKIRTIFGARQPGIEYIGMGYQWLSTIIQSGDPQSKGQFHRR